MQADADLAAARKRRQRSAVPIAQCGDVSAVEAGQLERLAVELFQFGQCQPKMKLAGRDPVRLSIDHNEVGVAPGVRLKLMIRGIEGAETDLTEEMAAAIFEDSATPYTWAVEAQMRKAAEARP